MGEYNDKNYWFYIGLAGGFIVGSILIAILKAIY